MCSQTPAIDFVCVCGFLSLFSKIDFLYVTLTVLDSLCRPCWPTTHRGFSCLLLLIAGIKGVHNHHRISFVLIVYGWVGAACVYGCKCLQMPEAWGPLQV